MAFVYISIMHLYLAYMIFAAEIPAVWNKQLLPLVIYCALTFISALASTDIGYSFSGIYEQFESVWILMGYGILVYYAFYVISSEAALKRLMQVCRWYCCMGVTEFTGLIP